MKTYYEEKQNEELTLYQRMSGIGFPSTTTAKRGVSPTLTSKSSMMVSNVGGAESKSTNNLNTAFNEFLERALN